MQRLIVKTTVGVALMVVGGTIFSRAVRANKKAWVEMEKSFEGGSQRIIKEAWGDC